MDNTQQQWYVIWADKIAYVTFSVITALITVAAGCWRLLRRLEAVEATTQRFSEDFDSVREMLTEFNGKLQKHQDDDNAQMAKLHDQYNSIAEPIARTAEAVDWIKKAIVDDRINTHENLGEVKAKLKDLESKLPPKRRPTR